MCYCDIHPAALCDCSSLYFDEDGDLAHEFYEETVVTKNGRKKAKLKRIQKNLIPQVRDTDPVRYMDTLVQIDRISSRNQLYIYIIGYILYINTFKHNNY